MVIDTISISFIIHPITIIDVAVNVDELSFAVGSVVFPVSVVESAVGPFLFTVAVSEASNPFAVVGGSCFECVG
jgi:hypothetical protein